MSDVKGEKTPLKIKTIVVDTLNSVQNNQYMKMLDKRTMVTRDKWKDK